MKQDSVINDSDVCFGRCQVNAENKCISREFKTQSDKTKCCLFALVLSCLFISVILPPVVYRFADNIVNHEVVIDSADHENFDTWQNNVYGEGKTKVNYNVYFFDLQNKADTTFNGSTPIVTEVGPYAYDEMFQKFDIFWEDGGNIVTYQTWKYYLFNQEYTNAGLSEDDEITLPYLPAVGFEYLFQLIPPEITQALADAEQAKLEALIANITAQVEEVYANNPVRRNFLLNEVENLNNRLEEYTTQSTPTAQLFKGLMCRLPESVNPDRNSAPFFKLNPSPAYFGWLNDPLLMEVQGLLVAIGQGDLPWTNAVPGTSTNWTSMDDVRRRKSPVTMYTGKKNPKEVARYIRYNNMTTLWVCLAAMDSQDPDAYDPTTQFPACKLFEYEWDDATAEAMGYVRPFATDWANKIGGTDAQMWGRPVTSEKLEVFVDDIYRTAYMEFKKTVYDWHQIPLRRYGLQTKDMENYTQNPVQAQYYQFGPEGLENLTAATGVPAFVSKPHFLGCDPSLVAAVKGVSPRADIHDTYLDLEPQTGLLARAKKRLQANYYIGDWVLPVMDGDTAESFNTVCLNETRKDGVNCMGVNEQINCLATPSWSFKDGGVYFPYAWVEESMVLTRDDADDLKESLYWIDGFAESVQLYSLVCSGIFMAILMGMLGQSYLHNKVGNSSIEVSEFKSSMVDDETQAIYQKTALLEPEQQQMTNERNAAGEDF